MYSIVGLFSGQMDDEWQSAAMPQLYTILLVKPMGLNAYCVDLWHIYGVRYAAQCANNGTNWQFGVSLQSTSCQFSKLTTESFDDVTLLTSFSGTPECRHFPARCH